MIRKIVGYIVICTVGTIGGWNLGGWIGVNVAYARIKASGDGPDSASDGFLIAGDTVLGDIGGAFAGFVLSLILIVIYVKYQRYYNQ